MRAATWLLGVALLAAAPACTPKPDDGTAPKANEPLPALSIRDDTPSLLLTWLDPKGGTHVEMHPGDVPAEGRGLVRVVVTDKNAGAGDQLYVVDLTKREADGSYLARTMPRRDWEAEIEARRVRSLPAAPPPSVASGTGTGIKPTSPAPAANGDVQVIIYGASWCKPCHQAAEYLQKKGVRYVLKDIEEDDDAAAEMQDKLAKTNQHGGSIPVIDVRGQVLVGFSPGAIDRALAKASGGTML